ncbi:hypothetical protein N7492_002953 [Penicillium capsulatum]|uniref:LysM domain-containing protein n=1 Tax=Penicillium capsulatum TaxID=69766 RepID=A0A9W9IIH6_9EURO|nr:hypothetical protein N7492_002953 [Penicillium capsulatum]
MFSLPWILAAGSFPLVFGAPVTYNLAAPNDTASSPNLVSRKIQTYFKQFGGNGDTAKGWPPTNEWQSFDTLWNDNLPMITSESCTAEDGGKPTSKKEAEAIRKAILNTSKQHVQTKGFGNPEHVAAFLMALMMQESKGCVYVHTTANANPNPGLMQTFNGKHSCHGKNDCSDDEITGMITDSFQGTNGLKACMSKALPHAEGKEGMAFFLAARLYNSGINTPLENVGQSKGATNCYVSDLANRLKGWNSGPSQCDPDTVGFQSNDGGSSGDSASSTTGSSQSTAAPEPSNPVSSSVAPADPGVTASVDVNLKFPAQNSAPAVPTPSAAATPSAVPTPSSNQNWNNNKASQNWNIKANQNPATQSTGAAGASASGAPRYPKAIASCQKYLTIVDGDFCQNVQQRTGVTSAQLLAWNPGLDQKCSNLWKGYQYCIKA